MFSEPNDETTWVDVAKKHKLLWVMKTEGGDLPPTVIAVKGGRVIATVVAPQVDKELGIQAAYFCRKGLDPDRLVVVFDAYVRTEERFGEGPNQVSDFNYEKGELQRMAAAGGCERGEISSCLICYLVDRNQEARLAIVPYYYPGKGKGKFRWTEYQTIGEQQRFVSEDENMALKGYVPETLRNIMGECTFIEMEPGRFLKERFEYNDTQAIFHSGRATLKLLQDQDFLVHDCLTDDPPDGIPFDEERKPIHEDPEPIKYRAPGFDELPEEIRQEYPDPSRVSTVVHLEGVFLLRCGDEYHRWHEEGGRWTRHIPE